MRAAGVFVQTADTFSSRVSLRANGSTYNAKSILSILSACIHAGDVIELQISGPDEQLCMDTLVRVVEGGLGEEPLAWQR